MHKQRDMKPVPGRLCGRAKCLLIEYDKRHEMPILCGFQGFSDFMEVKKISELVEWSAKGYMRIFKPFLSFKGPRYAGKLKENMYF